MTNIVKTNNPNLRLAAMSVGVLSTLRVSLPLVPADATNVEIIVTAGTTHNAYTAAYDSTENVWVCDIAASQFPETGKQKYEVAYKLGGKQFWDGAGWITIDAATTSGLTPVPLPQPARYVVLTVNGYGATEADGAVRIPKLNIGTEDPSETIGYIEGDQYFNRTSREQWVLCSVEGTLTWVKFDSDVRSVNGKVGDVSLGANDVGAYTKEETDATVERIDADIEKASSAAASASSAAAAALTMAENAQSAANAASEKADAANKDKADRASLAPEYSATSAYSVGAIVYHDGNIYQCTTAIAEGGEAWNAAHWQLMKLSDFFTGSNSLLTGTIDARIPYPLYAVPSTGLLKDRAINTTSLASVTVPDNFTDLLVRASVASSLSVTMPNAIATKYGDTFPGEAGEYLITITKTGAAEAYVRTIKLEVANA